MISLALVTIASSLIFVIFKLFDKFNISTFQAIVFNYFTAFACGYLMQDPKWENIHGNINDWGIIALMCSTLFISLFLIMGLSSQKNGVGTTSFAVKMSLAASFIGMILYHGDPILGMDISAIIIVLIGLILISQRQGNTSGTSAVWMLFVLFFGSAMLDFLLNYVNRPGFFDPYNASMFTAFGFLFAGSFGLLLLLIQLLRKKEVFAFKNVIAGLVLGIPNYFSIYFLLDSYTALPWKQTSILAIINVSVVLLSTIIGLILFKESFSWKKGIGLLLAIGGITLLMMA